MKSYFISFFIVISSFTGVYAQATFQSASGGNWNTSARWTLVSGSDADGIPDINDNVIILSGHTITLTANQECNNLTFSGGGISYNGSTRSLNVGGDVLVNGSVTFNGYSANQTFTVSGNTSVSSSASLSIPSITYTFTGSVDVQGTLAINGNSRTGNFGDVNIGATGSFTLSGGNNYYFNGDLVNDGTFTATSFGQAFYFTSSSGTFGGASLISLFEANFDSPANYTNEGNLQIRDNMSGTGAFTNGNGGQLELQNGGPFTVSTFNAAATGNTITYTGYGNPTAFTGSYYNLVLNKSSGSLEFGGSINVSNDLTIQSGILQVNAVTATIGNDLNLQGGEFTPDNASAVVNIGGDFNITGGQYDHNNGEVNVTGDVSMIAGEVLFSGTGSTLDISGTFTYDGGTANLQGGDFITNGFYVIAGNEIFINGVNLYVSGVVELDGTMTFNNTVGTKSIGSILVNASGNWNVTQPNNVTVNGDITNNGIFTGDPGYGTSLYTLTGSSGTIGGSNTLTIRDIEINSPGSYTNTGTLQVGSTFNGTGSFTNGANATLIYQGNNSAGTNFSVTNFTASATGNTVVYAAQTYNQQWRATTSSTNDYYNVVIQTNTGDYQTVNLAADIRVNGTLTITEGFVQLGSFDLEMAAGATISGGDASNYIRINGTGILRQYYTSVGATHSFPIGDSNDYSPITSFTINSGTLGSNPYVEMDITDANHPNRSTSNLGAGGNDDGVAATDYISRYWTLTGNDITSPKFDVSYQYIDGDITGTEANLIAALYRQPIGESFFDWKDNGTVNATNNTATISDGDNWGDLYAMDNNLDRLPVELISFEAKVLSGVVHVSWKTASEVNNNYFTVERSVDGESFDAVAVIDGAGDSNSIQNYTFLDENPTEGRSFYRLKQTDFSGLFEYSEVVSVLLQPQKEKLDWTVYPNPSNAGSPMNIRLSEEVEEHFNISLLNSLGEVVWTSDSQLFDADQLAIPGLPKGTYLIILTKSDQRLTKRLLIN